MNITTTQEFAIKTIIKGAHVECDVDTRAQNDRGGFIETAIFFADKEMISFSDAYNITKAMDNHVAAIKVAREMVESFDAVMSDEQARFDAMAEKVATTASVFIIARAKEHNEEMPF